MATLKQIQITKAMVVINTNMNRRLIPLTLKIKKTSKSLHRPLISNKINAPKSNEASKNAPRASTTRRRSRSWERASRPITKPSQHQMNFAESSPLQKSNFCYNSTFQSLPTQVRCHNTGLKKDDWPYKDRVPSQ